METLVGHSEFAFLPHALVATTVAPNAPAASSALKQYRPPATRSDMNFAAVTGYRLK